MSDPFFDHNKLASLLTKGVYDITKGVERDKKYDQEMTHPQLLKRLKCESKWETMKVGGIRARSLAHGILRGRGGAGASGWD
jgi:hypothetical protein